MNDTLIKVEGVSKKFCRSLQKSLWYGMKDLGLEFLGRRGSHGELRPDEFWANKDISFELRRGETLGLIGHNGAGKTTLLRMLNGLIKPDKGSIEVRGRMQALIALGAGFNPILSGRENIYVNAAVLGYSKREIDAKFDQIVEFSGIGEFVDSPVQNYSSGMAVRLGFSVAAHMDPDILLIDEILAVGDINFRKKCYAKIRDFRTSGAGIIVVTHDMTQLYNVSDKAILLNRGRIRKADNLDEVIREYWEYNLQVQQGQGRANATTGGNNLDAVITNVVLRNEAGDAIDKVRTGQRIIVQVDFEARKPIANPVFGLGISVPGADGSYLTALNTKLSKHATTTIHGLGSVFCEIDAFPLYPGRYEMIVTLNDDYGCRYDSREGDSAVRFAVEPGMMGTGEFFIKHRWSQKNSA